MAEKVKKVLFVQSSLHLRAWGGAPAVAAWMLEALRERFDVTVLTGVPVDVESLNRFYGTTLKPSEFRVIMPPLLPRSIAKLDPHHHSIQEYCLLLRHCKRKQSGYDVVISATHEADFGCPGIQYIHYPWCAHLYRARESITPLAGFRRKWGIFRYRFRPWWLISRFSFARMKQNLTLVNSDWTGTEFRSVYGGKTMTVYPPVPGQFPDIPWQERENGFVCTGRISAEKRLEALIEIMSAVRAQGEDIHFHIVGIASGDPHYYQRILDIIKKNSSWVFLHQNISRSELLRLIARHRYGIHGRLNEHFGISVAELVCGGCIVFAPDSGGQVEIVGDNERLLYENDEDAVEKILFILRDQKTQISLRDVLKKRRNLFHPERFRKQIQEIVGNFPGV